MNLIQLGGENCSRTHVYTRNTAEDFSWFGMSRWSHTTSVLSISGCPAMAFGYKFWADASTN